MHVTLPSSSGTWHRRAGAGLQPARLLAGGLLGIGIRVFAFLRHARRHRKLRARVIFALDEAAEMM